MNPIVLSSGPVSCLIEYSAEDKQLTVKRSPVADPSDRPLRIEVESWDFILLRCTPQAIGIFCGTNGALVLEDRLTSIAKGYPVIDILISEFVTGFILVTELSLYRIDETGRELGSASLSDVVGDAQCKQDGVHVTLFDGQKEVVPYSALGA